MGAGSHQCLTPFVIANVIRYLPSILDVDHHSIMQTFYHGCELLGASIFPQQLRQSSPPNGVECTEVDLALYTFLELLHYAPI